MNALLEIRQNIYYTKETSEGEYKKFHEIVLVIDKPKYSLNNELSVIRERGCEEVRFAVSENNLDTLIKQLIIYKDIKEEKMA